MRRKTSIARVSVVAGLAIAVSTQAQVPAAPSDPYPTPPAYPSAPPSAYPPSAYPTPSSPAAPSPARNAFAATLGAILQSAAAAGTMGLSQLVTGSITGWFNRKTYQAAGIAGAAAYPAANGVPGYTPYPGTDPNTAPSYGSQGYPAQSSYPTAQSGYPAQSSDPSSQSSYPTYESSYPAQPSYPSAATDSSANAYGSPYGSSGTAYYDPATGQPAAAVTYGSSGASDATALYAGIAYEVHATRPGGDSFAVNPATYEFHTGDRFLVQYRPSMPGRMEVYNVNPLGQTTLIDSVTMAAGQLSTLGPYEFAANTGDESLRLVLSPCSTPQLLTATRDIVNVGGSVMPGGAAPAGAGLQLSNCSSLGTRGVGRSNSRGDLVGTRDIRNVALDGGTSFALDPVSPQELTSGNVAARQVTIAFHHR